MTLQRPSHNRIRNQTEHSIKYNKHLGNRLVDRSQVYLKLLIHKAIQRRTYNSLVKKEKKEKVAQKGKKKTQVKYVKFGLKYSI